MFQTLTIGKTKFCRFVSTRHLVSSVTMVTGSCDATFIIFTSEHEDYTIPDKITNSRCKSLFLTIVITTSTCHTTLDKFKRRPCFIDPVSVVFPQTDRILYNSLWPLLVYNELQMPPTKLTYKCDVLLLIKLNFTNNYTMLLSNAKSS